MTDQSGAQRPLVALETINPLDVTPDELEALCSSLRLAIPEADFEVAYEEQHGAGVTWHEVINIFVPNVGSLRDNVYATMIGVVAENMRRRFHNRTRGKRRPRSFTIYDAETGEQIDSYILRESDGELEQNSGPEAKRIKPRPGKHRRA